MVKRSVYLAELLRWSDAPLIKVLRGVRRCGKSVLLRQYRDELVDRGVSPDRVLLINFESLSNAHLASHISLHQHIMAWARGRGGRVHILLDEVQLVESWERAVNSLRVDLDCDIVITGSNAWLLSGDLATLLTGRYVEIDIYPLSFAEHCAILEGPESDSYPGPPAQIEAAFASYLRLGGMPGVHELSDDAAALTYLRDVCNGIILKDVVARHRLRDVDLLERLMVFAMDSVGQIVSARSVSAFMKSQRRSLGAETVYNYLAALAQACLVFKVGRYDIKGKRNLETLEKYFLADHAFAHAWLGYRPDEIPGILENIVYLELRRRGWSVHLGKMDAAEIDFVAEKQGRRLYLQVAYLLTDPATVEREFAPLAAIPDNHRKLVLTMDKAATSARDGIERHWLPEFLLADW